jgi:hypothetical protein
LIQAPCPLLAALLEKRGSPTHSIPKASWQHVVGTVPRPLRRVNVVGPSIT